MDFILFYFNVIYFCQEVMPSGCYANEATVTMISIVAKKVTRSLGFEDSSYLAEGQMKYYSILLILSSSGESVVVKHS